MDVELKESANWTNIRPNLSRTYDYNDDWKNAISLFRKRLKRKFFNPVQKIINDGPSEGEGFTIVTVQCALIEAFAAFRVGKIYNHNKTKPYEYNKSQQMFTSFLKEAEIFKDHFWIYGPNNARVVDQPYDSRSFYSEVRCGLMHEARTKGNWIINSPAGLNPETTRVFIVPSQGKLSILRSVLHYRLLAYLDEYCSDLKENTPSGRELRKYFARKMDHLFDVAEDANDWWT